MTLAATRRRRAFRVAAAYLAVGALWILLTDVVVYSLAHSPVAATRLQTAKGWFFVTASSLLIYGLLASLLYKLQRQERTMNAVVKSIADGVLLIGRDTRISAANRAAAEMLGESDAADLVGIGPEEFCSRYHVSLPDGTLVAPHEYASQRALRGETVRSYKAVVFPGSQSPRVILATSAPVVLDSAGRPDLVVSVMHDLTEHDRLEALRDEFFAETAHALKTPLAVIKAHAQLLERRQTNMAHSPTAVIIRQCGAMDRLIQNQLVLARVRSGTLRLHQRLVDAAELVEGVSREMRAATTEHEVSADIRQRPAVFADPERMAQVLRNLVDRAFHTAPRGTPVSLLLQQSGHLVRMGVRSSLGAAQSLTWSDQMEVGDHVNENLVAASGGRLIPGDHQAGTDTRWIELPLSNGDSHAPG